MDAFSRNLAHLPIFVIDTTMLSHFFLQDSTLSIVESSEPLEFRLIKCFLIKPIFIIAVCTSGNCVSTNSFYIFDIQERQSEIANTQLATVTATTMRLHIGKS